MLNPMQQVILTVFLGPESKHAWKNWLRREYIRKWHRDNYGQVKKAKKKWRKANPENCRKNARLWKARHPDMVRAQHRKWKTEEWKNNSTFRLTEGMRTRLRLALKNCWKSGNTLELLGCTIPELRAHLESLFVPGMTWENYGPGWTIDHKRPCASFDLSDPAQQRECFNWKNLQPLWALDNIKKGAKYSPAI